MKPAHKTEAAKAGGPHRARSAARVAATQALYQILLTDASAEDVIAEFEAYRRGGEADGSSLSGADLALFSDIVRGAAARREAIEALLTQGLAADWPLARLETLLRAVLWAGVYELVARPDIPLHVVINEYVDVAHAFFAEKEPAFVNGVLDRLAREVRGPEAQAGGETARSG